MNKQELIGAVFNDTTFSRSEAEYAVNSVIGNIVAAVCFNSGDVRIPGFGIFTTKLRPARTARNPRTGEPVEIAAQTVVKFVPAKAFKNRVNGRG